MGDYYKYKKILVILMIISCGFSIIKNIFKTNVQATEAVEVTPSWNDGSYTYLADNNYLDIVEDYKNLQFSFINALYNYYDTGNKENVKASIENLYKLMLSRDNTGPYTRFVYFTKNLSDASLNYTYMYQVIGANNFSSVVYKDANLENGYKISNTPFYSFSRSNTRQLIGFNRFNGTDFTISTTGNVEIPCACVGVYVYQWLDLFKYLGLINDTSDYNNLLASIEETNEMNYTENMYTKEAVQNTYSYITNGNTETITETGITQPEVSQPDLSDTFDTLTDLLTNENYHNKNFTLTLPNNDKFNFSIEPDFLKTSLTRVGGTSLVTIIQTLWYIGLYGIMIFLSLKIIGSLLAGDLDSVVGSFSPVNSVVNSSLECTGAFKLGDNTDGAFRRR